MSSSSSDATPELLEIGRIEKAHGLRGEVVVSLLTNMVDDRTAPGTTLDVGDRHLVVTRSRPHGNRWLVTFEGVDSREEAEALRGRILLAEPLSSDGADPGPPSASARHGEEVVAYVHELIGRHIVDQHGNDHGPVTSVLENPASDLLELADGRLVPLTFYRGHDAGANTVTVDVPSGLLDAVPDGSEPDGSAPDRSASGR